jgi:aspartyl-tRNA(Asn)/glutamyl-tRNA(Gln) amidotransferase subunit B
MYYPVIGLEVHVQLNSKTKLFCACLNEYAPDEPNKNICPFCTGQPGALPVLNKACVKKAIEFGVAVGGKIPEKTRWDRKNYFYPDLPAGYQISQYDNPIVEGGKIEFYIENKTSGEFVQKSVNLTRAHLEADAAKLLHAGGKTMVDFNRSAAPLIEIVSEPEIHSAAEAMGYVSELQLLVRRLGISDGDMDKGQMRFDCNLSLQNDEEHSNNKLPKYRTETKNINSIRALGRAIEYEIKRQTELLNEGITPKQETRGWKDDLNKSDSQRSKEDAMDYRYFPEPDLQILVIKPEDKPSLSDLPELPAIQRKRYQDLGINLQISNTFVTQSEVGEFFDKVIVDPELQELYSKSKTIIKTAANIITGNLIALSTKLELPISALISTHNLINLADLFENDKINNQGIIKTIDYLVENRENKALEAEEIAATHGWLQVSDEGALLLVVNEVIANNPKVVEEYKSGKVQVIGFLVGQCMKASKGAGNPKKFTELLEKTLN